MQVKLDDEFLFEITETDILLLKNAYVDVDEEIRYRIPYFIKHACHVEFEKIKLEAFKLFSKDPNISNIPLDRSELVKLVTNHPGYKNQKARVDEYKLNEDKIMAEMEIKSKEILKNG